MNKEIQLIKSMNGIYNKGSNQVNACFESDAEIIRFNDNDWLTMSTDHVNYYDFISDIDEEEFGYHAVAVSLSDIIAVGSKPEGIVISLHVPMDFSTERAEMFSRGALKAAEAYSTTVLGGDTTLGSPLSATTTAIGSVPAGEAILRKGAKPGDFIYVTGPVGRANARAYCIAKGKEHQMNFNIHPRIHFTNVLRKYASSCTDTSDGVASAIGNLLRASGGRYHLNESLQLYDPESAKRLIDDGLPPFLLLLGGAGEYELLFTVSKEKNDDFLHACKEQGLTAIPLGIVEEGKGLILTTTAGEHEIEPEWLQKVLEDSQDPMDYVHNLLHAIGVTL